MIELTTPKFIELIPNYVVDIAEKLQSAGFEAYLVGGSIRDVLLDKTPNDFDIATNAYPEDITKIFPKSVAVGEQFGTITVVGEDDRGERFDVEVTTYRSEADYVGGRWPSKVEFTKTIQEDLARRDFTINSIALDLQNFDDSDINIQEIVIDPFDGITDLKNKLIKAVRDPIERFSEDGLRAMRACRLASQLEFKIDKPTLDAIPETLHITKQISIERFRDEFLKILYKSPKPSVGLRLLKETGILKLFIPELLEGIDVVQPQYHADDVFEHSLLSCDLAEDDIKLAALFHDIAKPRTESEDEKGIHFYGHDVKGAEMTKEIMKRLRFSNSEIEKVATLIRWHMFYYPSAEYRNENENYKEEINSEVKNFKSQKPNITQAPDSIYETLNRLDEKQMRNPQLKTRNSFGWSDGAVRRLIRNVGGEDAIEDLLKLRIADASANPKSDFNPEEIDALASRVSEVRAGDMALKVEDLDITGRDLMTELNIKPGPEIGKILSHLLELVIDDPLLNKKEDLLRLAKELQV